MMTADLALALLINRTSESFQAKAPLYMTYTEHTHISAPSLGAVARHQPIRLGARR